MNDRALRNVVIGLGGAAHGVTRESGFDITAASELMAILCLAEDRDDLRARLGRILVGFDRRGDPVTADDLGATGAMSALLRDALMPNLVQTVEGTPALVHGGPFANIAHGCNSIIATRTAMQLADWVVTEAGFGFDLGAEKFFDIKCRQAGLDTAAVVLVATVRALKMHGGVARDALTEPDPAAVARGLPNLTKHIESIGLFGERCVVAINRFGADTAEELAVIAEWCQQQGVPVAVTDHFGQGGAGAEDLARLVMAEAEDADDPTPFIPLYQLEDLPVVKIRKVAQAVYGAHDVVVTKEARRDLGRVKRLGLQHLPVCIAKTQSSLSDNPKLRGRPRGFELTIRRVQIAAGAGFLVVLTGDIVRMPGLPRRPSALDIDLKGDVITGVS